MVPLPAREQIRNNTRVSLVYWLALAGIGVWSMLAASRLVPDSPPVDTFPFLIVLLLETCNLAARSYDRFRRDRTGEPEGVRRRPFSWTFVTVDLILVAAGLRYTGGFHSPLWVVIFLIGIAETLLAPAAEAYLVRYGAILSLLLGTFPSDLSGFTGNYLPEMALRIGSFLAVSSVARRLRLNHEAKERENASLRAELALAQERSHLSREVHDGIGNSLAASVLRLEFAAHRAEKEQQPQTADLLREEADFLRTAMSAIRDWTFFTKPWSVGDQDGTAPSVRLQAETERLARRTRLEIQMEGAEILDTLPPPSQLAVLRIVQEALTNTVKHAAEARQAEVRLARDRDKVTLTIADDGAGFDPDGAAGTGIGMHSMRERAEGLGGTFTVDSKPGLGTTLTAILPA
ncbi:MAG: sensor histidine kinase [Capsulimonadales bacterium]|nr:sensor histidine kinase [Capsulimonadales bacterium]